MTCERARSLARTCRAHSLASRVGSVQAKSEVMGARGGRTRGGDARSGMNPPRLGRHECGFVRRRSGRSRRRHEHTWVRPGVRPWQAPPDGGRVIRRDRRASRWPSDGRVVHRALRCDQTRLARGGLAGRALAVWHEGAGVVCAEIPSQPSRLSRIGGPRSSTEDPRSSRALRPARGGRAANADGGGVATSRCPGQAGRGRTPDRARRRGEFFDTPLQKATPSRGRTRGRLG